MAENTRARGGGAAGEPGANRQTAEGRGATARVRDFTHPPPHCAPPGGDGGSPAASGGVQRRPSAVARVGEEPRASPAPTARPRRGAVRL